MTLGDLYVESTDFVYSMFLIHVDLFVIVVQLWISSDRKSFGQNFLFWNFRNYYHYNDL